MFYLLKQLLEQFGSDLDFWEFHSICFINIIEYSLLHELKDLFYILNRVCFQRDSEPYPLGLWKTLLILFHEVSYFCVLKSFQRKNRYTSNWNWFFLYPIEAIHVFCRHDVIKASKASRMRKIKIMNTQAKYLKFTKYRYYRCFHPHVAGFFVKNIGKLYAYGFWQWY